MNGFSGSFSEFASTPFIDAGLTYGPGAYLYFTQYNNDTIGELKPGSTTADYTLSLPGVPVSTGGLNFIPVGFGGGGNAAISSFNGESICSASVMQAGNGSYAFGAWGLVLGGLVAFTSAGILRRRRC